MKKKLLGKKLNAFNRKKLLNISYSLEKPTTNERMSNKNVSESVDNISTKTTDMIQCAS